MNPAPKGEPAFSKPSRAPKAKVAAGGIAGALSVMLVFVAAQAGVDVPPEVASAFTVLVSFFAGYVKSA